MMNTPGSKSRVMAMSAAVAIVVLVTLLRRSPSGAASAQQLPPDGAAASGTGTKAGGMGRLYIFRQVLSYGAHIDDDVTINGVPVQSVSPGTGFYCDVSPGDYVIGVLRHKTHPLKVRVAAGQRQYICVMLHHLGGVAPRGGALTSDQSFDVRLLEPGYGAQRVQEYRLTQANCQR
jgi:hypothetical protein